jgi:predicted O-methyltransferase YrrM
MTFNLSNTNHIEETIRAVQYGDLSFPNEFYRTAFHQFLHLVTLAWHTRATNILELGAGISTVLFSDYAERTGTSFYSIDTSFDRVLKICARNQKRLATVERFTCFVNGATVSGQSLEDFYNTGHKSLCSVPTDQLLSVANHFIDRNIRHQRYAPLEKTLNESNWDATRLFQHEGMLKFSRPLLDHFSEHTNFASMRIFLSKCEQEGHGDIIENQGLNETDWDMILFDCGELTSLLEFQLLSSSIRPGGFAVFHDIFFPKSFKNFIACAIVSTSPQWEIIHIDNSTIQGLLIAQKKERPA